VEEFAVVQARRGELLAPVVLDLNFQSFGGGHTICPDHPAGHGETALIGAFQACESSQSVAGWVMCEGQERAVDGDIAVITRRQLPT